MERLIITYRKRQMGQPVTLASRFLGEVVKQETKSGLFLLISEPFLENTE